MQRLFFVIFAFGMVACRFGVCLETGAHGALLGMRKGGSKFINRKDMKGYVRLVAAILFGCSLTGCADFNPNKIVKNLTGKSGDTVSVAPKDTILPGDGAHLKFKGIPLDGTLDAFVARLEADGFSKVSLGENWEDFMPVPPPRYGAAKSGEEGDGVTTLEGEFAGYKGCRVEVSTLKGKDLVARINVNFPAQKRWAGLYGNYKDLKDMMTAKYGRPTGCVEEFRKDAAWEKIDDDQDKYLKVMLGKATFETTFRFTNGTILLRMARGEMSDCFVQLSYMDKANDSAVKMHAMDDL